MKAYALVTSISSDCGVNVPDDFDPVDADLDPDDDLVLTVFDDSTPPDPCTGGETVACDDNCPRVFNINQADADGDGIGDVCDQVVPVLSPFGLAILAGLLAAGGMAAGRRPGLRCI